MEKTSYMYERTTVYDLCFSFCSLNLLLPYIGNSFRFGSVQ